MTRQKVIHEALSIVREIEHEVRVTCFPAWDAESLNIHPDINRRFRECVNHVVAVYCAHTKEELIPELNGLLTAMHNGRSNDGC